MQFTAQMLYILILFNNLEHQFCKGAVEPAAAVFKTVEAE